eukprot:8234498-Lingulodinium_polyedra.AAC.1
MDLVTFSQGPLGVPSPKPAALLTRYLPAFRQRFQRHSTPGAVRPPSPWVGSPMGALALPS